MNHKRFIREYHRERQQGAQRQRSELDEARALLAEIDAVLAAVQEELQQQEPSGYDGWIDPKDRPA